MLIEQRTYTLEPGTLPRFLAAYESLGFEAHRDIYERLVGYFVSETGTLNQIVHMWAFDSFEDRNARRDQLQRDPRWQKYMEQVKGLVIHQESRLLRPTGWSPAVPRLNNNKDVSET